MTRQHAHQRRPARTNGEQPADVLAALGITGNPARVMTLCPRRASQTWGRRRGTLALKEETLSLELARLREQSSDYDYHRPGAATRRSATPSAFRARNTAAASPRSTVTLTASFYGCAAVPGGARSVKPLFSSTR
jgi:hypothetical protein